MWFTALTLLTLTQAQALLTPVELPSQVLTALELNHAIGRGEWDSHSVHTLQEFDVLSGTDLEEVLAQVIQHSGDMDLLSYCEDFSSRQVCASSLLSGAEPKSPSTMEVVRRWATMNYDAHEGQVFRQSLRAIVDHVERVLGDRAEEYQVVVPDWMTQSVTAILVSPSKVVLLGYNQEL